MTMMGPGAVLRVDYGPDTNEEIRIKKKLFDLRCEYQEKAEPLIKRLVEIQESNTPRYLVVPD